MNLEQRNEQRVSFNFLILQSVDILSLKSGFGEALTISEILQELLACFYSCKVKVFFFSNLLDS